MQKRTDALMGGYRGACRDEHARYGTKFTRCITLQADALASLAARIKCNNVARWRGTGLFLVSCDFTAQFEQIVQVCMWR